MAVVLAFSLEGLSRMGIRRLKHLRCGQIFSIQEKVVNGYDFQVVLTAAALLPQCRQTADFTCDSPSAWLPYPFGWFKQVLRTVEVNSFGFWVFSVCFCEDQYPQCFRVVTSSWGTVISEIVRKSHFCSVWHMPKIFGQQSSEETSFSRVGSPQGHWL